jgi:hypothetical protein
MEMFLDLTAGTILVAEVSTRDIPLFLLMETLKPTSSMKNIRLSKKFGPFFLLNLLRGKIE